MIREGLDCLRVCLLECREFDRRFTAHVSSRDGDWNRSLPRSDSQYSAFLQNLHFTTQRMVQPLNPMLVMDIFYATMILAMIRRILFASESSRQILGLKVTEDSSSLPYQPMMRVLESSNKTFDVFCYDVYCKKFPKLEERQHLGNLAPHCNVLVATMRLFGETHTLLGELKHFIDRVEFK